MKSKLNPKPLAPKYVTLHHVTTSGYQATCHLMTMTCAPQRGQAGLLHN